MKRVMDAAVLLGVDAVCGFVGPQPEALDGPEPRRLRGVVRARCSRTPRSAASRYRVEQCPMPGWTTGDNFHNNIAYAPGAWIALHRICEKHGVGDQFRIHYDPSHAILMGQDTRSHLPVPEGRGLRLPDRRLPREGPGHRRQGRLGLGLRRPDDGARRLEGRRALAEPGRPGERLEEADRAVRARAARHRASTTRSPTCRTARVDWLDHQLAARELLTLDVPNTHLVVEHEYPKARIQDKEKLKPILAGLDRLHAQDRRGRRLHVRAAARGAGRAGHPGAGPGPRGVPQLSLHRLGAHTRICAAALLALTACATSPYRHVSRRRPELLVVTRDQGIPPRVDPHGGEAGRAAGADERRLHGRLRAHGRGARGEAGSARAATRTRASTSRRRPATCPSPTRRASWTGSRPATRSSARTPRATRSPASRRTSTCWAAHFLRHGPNHVKVDLLVKDASHPSPKGGPAAAPGPRRDLRVRALRPVARASAALRREAPGDGRARRVSRSPGRATHGKGRVFYTALGHRDDVLESDWYGAHLLAGIVWALGASN